MCLLKIEELQGFPFLFVGLELNELLLHLLEDGEEGFWDVRAAALAGDGGEAGVGFLVDIADEGEGGVDVVDGGAGGEGAVDAGDVGDDAGDGEEGLDHGDGGVLIMDGQEFKIGREESKNQHWLIKSRLATKNRDSGENGELG